MGRNKSPITAQEAKHLGEAGKNASYFGMCAADRERLMRMRRERSLRFVVWDEPTWTTTVEVASRD